MFNLNQFYSIQILSPLLILLSIISCDSLIENKGKPYSPLPDNIMIYLSIDGGNNNSGLWRINANTLQKIDSLETGQGVPHSVEFAQDYSRWYSIWTDHPSREDILFCVDNSSNEIIKSNYTNSSNPFVAFHKEREILITFAGGIAQFYNSESLSLIKEDSSLGIVWQVIPSKLDSRLFITNSIDRNFRGLSIYNLDTYQMEKVIPIIDEVRMKNMQSVSLDTTPDERFAFLSTFNWIGGSGYNSFFVIDIQNSKVIHEYNCGSFAQVAASPDGKYVYISDPAGYLYDMLPTNKMLRYNVLKHSFEIFLTPSKLSINTTEFITDKIIIAQDNRTLFVNMLSNLRNNSGNLIHLLKIDIETKKIIGTYSLSEDYRGYITQHIKNIKLGWQQ